MGPWQVRPRTDQPDSVTPVSLHMGTFFLYAFLIVAVLGFIGTSSQTAVFLVFGALFCVCFLFLAGALFFGGKKSRGR